jgi:hypothetical protein
MTIRLAVAATAILIAGSAGAYAAELPTYEATGFPVSQVQVQVLSPAQAQEQPRVATLTRDGMPASPHQVSVLGPHKVKVGALAPNYAAR